MTRDTSRDKLRYCNRKLCSLQNRAKHTIDKNWSSIQQKTKTEDYLHRRFLPNVEPKFQTRKKKFQFFSLYLLSIPRNIPWHHLKNLLTSKRGHSRGFNFFTKSGWIWLKTSGGSRDLNFNPICKCHTISETSWCPYEALHNLIDLWGKCSQLKTKTNGQCPECKRL